MNIIFGNKSCGSPARKLRKLVKISTNLQHSGEWIGVFRILYNDHSAEKALNCLVKHGRNMEPNRYFASNTLEVFMKISSYFFNTFLRQVPSPFACYPTC